MSQRVPVRREDYRDADGVLHRLWRCAICGLLLGCGACSGTLSALCSWCARDRAGGHDEEAGGC